MTEYINPLRGEQVQRLLMVTEDLPVRDQLLVRVPLYTGMRIGELVPLTARDVDVRRGSITLSKVVTTPYSLGHLETHGGAKRQGINPKTGRPYSSRPVYNPRREIVILLEAPDGTELTGERTVGTPEKLLALFPHGELIKEGLKSRHPTRIVPLADRTTLSLLADWISGTGSRFIWTSQKGGRLRQQQVYRIVRATMLKAGIPDPQAHPHQLRHTFAVHFLRKTSDIARLQRILGHENIATTTIYLRFAFDDLKAALDRAGDIFSEDRAQPHFQE